MPQEKNPPETNTHRIKTNYLVINMLTLWLVIDIINKNIIMNV